jgi:CRP-like cAMP-binding protein
VTATAREPSTVIRISRSLFLKMLEGYPEAAYKLREQLVARAQQSVGEMRQVRAKLDAGDKPH